MVVHEAVPMTQPMVALVDMREDFEKCLAILVVLEHCFFIVAPIGDVIHGAGVFDAERAGHNGEFIRSLDRSTTV
jgi:hypothetical protein